MRSVPEWIGRTDDQRAPDAVQQRIIERQFGRCAITGLALTPATGTEFDHIEPLWLGGKNVESNLQAVTRDAHKGKTKAEATVRAKVNAVHRKHLGIKKAAGRPMPGSKASGIKKRMDGRVERRNDGPGLWQRGQLGKPGNSEDMDT